jgi:Uma2 family endonuclease
MDILTKTYTVSEFLALSDELDPKKRYELVNGEIVEMAPSNRVNSFIAALIVTEVNIFIRQNKLDAYALGADGGFAIDEENLRIPDVSFIYKERMPNIGDMDAIVAPDFAVEVISPSETPRKINEKTALYLTNGTKLVWNVYPQERVVEVWTMGSNGKLEMQPFFEGDSVTGGDVLPGFSLEVTRIFNVVPREDGE